MSHMDIISRLCSLVTIMLLKEGISVPSLFRHRMASLDVLVLHSIRWEETLKNTYMYSSFVRFTKSISRNWDIRLFWKNLVKQVKTQQIWNITWDYNTANRYHRLFNFDLFLSFICILLRRCGQVSQKVKKVIGGTLSFTSRPKNETKKNDNNSNKNISILWLLRWRWNYLPKPT